MLDATNLMTPCPKCGEGFTPARSNQSFCSRACQKATSGNTARGPRLVADSPEERRRNEFRSGRIQGLSHAFFETPPAYRAEFMQRLIAEGRAKKELRGLLTKREFLRSWTRHDGTGRLHIVHCLAHYCREVYGLRSYEVLNPERTLPNDEELAFPAEYFGPDAPPVYEDGSLKERPCPFGGPSKANPPSTIYKGNFRLNSEVHLRG